MATIPGLSISDLHFRYPAMPPLPDRDVLRGVTLGVGAGERAVLLGSTDEGKTTLARILTGLVPRFTGGARAGSASFGGRNLLDEPPYSLMDCVGLVFQDPEEQLITSRCDAEIALGMEALGLPRPEMQKRIEASLRMMGLETMAGRNPGTLSGGEKKRLLIACLAAIDPSLWILDEVFQELDDEWRTRLLDHVAGRERTVLFLDSRWTSLYAQRGVQPSILDHGAASPPVRGAVPDARLLMDSGFVLDASARSPDTVAGPCILRAERLAVSYPSEPGFQLAVDELSLHAGTVTALLGRNGSGKTTLGRVLCGLLGPSRGRVLLGSQGALLPADRETLRRRVGYLFQNPDSQVFLPTVAEELGFGMRSAPLGPAEKAERVQDAVARFQLPDPLMPPSLMSYGARRRLQAATCHLSPRDVLVLDEVDSGLGYRDILPLLDALGGPSRALVLITHDRELARYVASRVIVMDGGRVVEDSPSDRTGAP